MNTTGIPRTFAVSSIVSRVVPGDMRHDGAIVPEQLIQQTGLARVGPTDDRRPDAAPENLSFIRRAQQLVHELDAALHAPFNWLRAYLGAMSSSGKSMCASMCASVSINSSRS
jgi:hypothetical protein